MISPFQLYIKLLQNLIFYVDRYQISVTYQKRWIANKKKNIFQINQNNIFFEFYSIYGDR